MTSNPPPATADRSCRLAGGPLSSRPLSEPVAEPVSAGPPASWNDQLSRATRVNLAIGGAALMLVWSVAWWLEPSPAGLGTHQQLGLPPCSFRWVFGQRCPSCGMTTAWAHLAEGRLSSALRANVGGTLLGLATWLALPWAGWKCWTGRRGRGWPGDRALLTAAVTVAAITLVDWYLRIR